MEIYHAHGLKNSKLLRCQFSPNGFRNQCNTSKNPHRIFKIGINKLILKFLWQGKENRTVKSF